MLQVAMLGVRWARYGRPLCKFARRLSCLQVHIGQAAPHTEVSNIGLVAIPELKGGTADSAVGELVVDVVGGMSSSSSQACSDQNACSNLSQVPEATLLSQSVEGLCALCARLVCHAPCAVCNPVPNELSPLVMSECDQLTSRVLGFSHCLVLLEHL